MRQKSPGYVDSAQEHAVARRERRRAARRKAIPLILALVVLVAAPMLIFLLVSATTFRDPQAIPGRMNGFGNGMAIGLPIALLVLFWLVALVTLMMDGGKLVAERFRRADRTCPNCGLREAPPAVGFGHKAIPSTGWQENTCPQCAKVWHTRL
jgi:hypothetical protein